MEGEGTPFRVGSLLPPNLPHPPRTFLSRGLYTVLLLLPCCVARRGAVEGRGTNPGSGKFLLDWGGLESIKRAAIAHVWWVVAALFALLAKIRWGAGGRFFCLTFIICFFFFLQSVKIYIDTKILLCYNMLAVKKTSCFYIYVTYLLLVKEEKEGIYGVLALRIGSKK